MSTRIVIIVQARMGATRLPGKPLKKVLGKPLLKYLIERLLLTKNVEEIVVATTTNPKDDCIAALCQDEQIPVFRGNEEDVLDRYYQAAQSLDAEVIVRITADCPLIDPAVVDRVITFYLDNAPNYDYVSNVIERTFPRGMDVELFTFQALEEAQKEATSPEDREHVTAFFYRRPERYRLANVPLEENHSHHRWTVDTPEDLVLVTKIIETLYPKNKQFSLEEMLQLLKENPEWEKINAHIQQKPTCKCPEK